MQADREFSTGVLWDLVRINSVNPAFTDGATDEREIAAYVADRLDELGLQVDRREPRPGRVSVVGRLPGGDGPSLMLYAHTDTVAVGAMAEPFAARIADGRLYGRGAYDMKSGLAACLTAVKALAESTTPPRGDVLLVAVADEEVASLGMEDVLQAHRADRAIVTEPTDLRVCVAHKGFTWIEVETLGRAAHGSRYEEGVDANLRMGRFLAELDRLEREIRARPPHPLLGPPSLHAGRLEGGTAASVYAARSRVEIERRTLPGETEAQVAAEIEDILERLRGTDRGFDARARVLLTRPPFETSPAAPIVSATCDAVGRVLGDRPEPGGETYWMDAALLAQAGVDTVVIGARGAGAHADEEWVDVASVATLAEILVATADAGDA